MHTKLTRYQEKLLTDLIEAYERSRTYGGINQVKQSFSKKPSQIFKDYNSDYTEYNLVQDFENQMRELEEESLISIDWENGVIQKLYANTDAWNHYNTLLKRTDKNVLVREELSFYQKAIGSHKWIDAFCKEQIERLESGKRVVYPLEEVKVLVCLLKHILSNTEELLERELSILFFKDSKTFEKSYRTKVCSWLRKYGEYDLLLEGIHDKRETEQILLAEHNIYANPSYVFFKGAAVLYFDDGNTIQVPAAYPIALSSDAIMHIEKTEIIANTVMTIENLTSFNRICLGDTFYIFLSGYHNTTKKKLLKNIYEQNRELQWLHFGDLDPDGLYIVEHLISGTGIPFQTYHMSVEDMQTYKKYTKPLGKNDKTKAASLLSAGKYTDLIEYMLLNNVKLEQEIISLELNR